MHIAGLELKKDLGSNLFNFIVKINTDSFHFIEQNIQETIQDILAKPHKYLKSDYHELAKIVIKETNEETEVIVELTMNEISCKLGAFYKDIITLKITSESIEKLYEDHTYSTTLKDLT